MKLRIASIVGCIVVLICSGRLATSSTSPSRDDEVSKEFLNRVRAYIQIRDAQGNKRPKPTSSAEQVTRERREFAERVRLARANVKEGAIFGPPVDTLFRKQIAEAFAGPNGNKIRVSLRHAEPVRTMNLGVNDFYPQGIPLQSTPPSLLLDLPVLPKGLQYRIVGRDLVLLDTTTNLIVDVLRDGIPEN
jgi:hypothetical protein